MREAQGSRTPIARLADRVSGIFVPTVIVLAAATFAAWWFAAPEGSRLSMAVVTSVSVLIIACPCALGLATPTAIMVGTGAAAARGILIKNGAAIETAGRLTTVVFDKTGTLTSGRPELTDVIPSPGVAEDDLLRLAAAAEASSEHPVARAIVREAARRGIGLPVAVDFKATAGRGVEARVGGREVLVGNEEFLKQRGVPPALMDQAETLAAMGRTPMFVAAAGTTGDRPEFVGLLAVADRVKDGAASAVARLGDMGLRVVMMTGDNPRTAREVARVVGIESALAVADVSMAMGSGADVAIESSDIAIVRGDPGSVADAVVVSRATMRTIRQNLFWAFSYNAAAIPLAAGVLYPFTGWLLSPMIASAAMAFSSLSVVLNSLRLGRALGRSRGGPVVSGS